MSDTETAPADLKTCKKCGEVKPLTEFAILRKAKDGHHGWCLACKRTYGTNPNAVVRVPPEAMAAIRRERDATGKSLSGIICAVLTREFAPGAPCDYNHADGRRRYRTTAGGVKVSAVVTSLSRVRQGSGRLWRALSHVDVVYLDDLARRERVAMVVGPRHIGRVSRFLGVAPELLPAPGTCDDYLNPAEAPE